MAESVPKLKILPGAAADLSAATYQIHDECHTIGNTLRWMLMKKYLSPFDFLLLRCQDEVFVPHPSENVINVRIQMYDNLSSLDALIEALDSLDQLVESVEDAYIQSLKEKTYTDFEEEG